MFVKLCGLRTADDARAAMDAGASALGFILAVSKRQVSPEFVASLRDEVANPPSIVGVTVNNTADELTVVYEAARLDMLQLSGDEPIEILDEIEMPLIKSLKFPAGTSVDQATSTVDAWLSHRHAPEIVMIDAHHASAHGGTGELADWKLVSEITVRYPVVLAGGLTPDNVSEAIRKLRPIGVDVASGTETDGVKDPVKLRAFVANARAAFEAL
jgi:phosphoribosylanthranilate isomerase